MKNGTVIEMFLRHVQKTPTCWIWTGGKVGNGYGAFRFKSKIHRAHRVIWELVNGPIPEGICICHKCDDPACVNPDHLWLGTPRQNSMDKILKGRSAKGEMYSCAKLTDAKVREIRNIYKPGKISQIELANIYQVKQPTISCILNRKRWAHVT